MTQAVCSVDFRPDNKSKNLLTSSPTQGLELEDLLSLRNSFVLVKPSPSYCITAAPYVECQPCESCIFLRSEWRRLGGGGVYFVADFFFFSSVVVRSLFSPGVRVCAVFFLLLLLLHNTWLQVSTQFPCVDFRCDYRKTKTKQNKTNIWHRQEATVALLLFV